MSKPDAQKDIKMKNEENKVPAKGGGLLVNVITTTLICSIFLGVNYIMMSDISKTQKAMLAKNEEPVEEDTADVPTKGVVLDLGEFTMNLADSSTKAYLKTAVAIEVTTIETDPMNQVVEAKGGGGHGHGGGAPAVDPKEQFEQMMAQYRPAIRDVIITVLSSKTSDELATATGKELAKEQITEQINAIFGGEREVLRVSFGQFIMQ